MNNYLANFSCLCQYPWRILYLGNYLDDFYFQHIKRPSGIKMKEKIDMRYNDRLFNILNFDISYPFIFIKSIRFVVNINGIPSILEVLFTVGKSENGSYHILSPQNTPIRNIQELLKFTRENNVRNISNIVCGLEIKYSKEILFEYEYLSVQHILCLSSLFLQMINIAEHEQKRQLNTEEINKIESIFNQSNRKDTVLLLNQYISEASQDELLIFKHLKIYLNRFIAIYHYRNNLRPIISTTNIILFLYQIINVLLQDQNFPNIEEAKRYITIAAHNVINYGGDLIPNWHFLTKPV